MTHVHCAWEYKAQGVTAAQMNLYYGLAVIALDGVAFTEQYREERLDGSAHARLHRPHQRVRRSRDRGDGRRRSATRRACKVTTRDGRELREASAPPPRQPENPLKPEEIEYKFRHVVSPCLSPRTGTPTASSRWSDRLETRCADLSS